MKTLNLMETEYIITNMTSFPHTRILAPLEYVIPLENPLHLEVIYDISYQGLKKPIIIPSNLVIVNDKDHRSTWKDFIEYRNQLLHWYVHNSWGDKEDPKKFVLTVGDTTIVGINDYNYCNSEKYSLKSLDQLKVQKKTIAWWKFLIFLSIFGLLFYPFPIESWNYEYQDKRRKGIIKKTWKELDIIEKAYVVLFAVICIFSLALFVFGIFSLFFIFDFFYK